MFLCFRGCLNETKQHSSSNVASAQRRGFDLVLMFLWPSPYCIGPHKVRKVVFRNRGCYEKACNLKICRPVYTGHSSIYIYIYHPHMCHAFAHVSYIRYSHSNACYAFCIQTCVILSVFTLKHVLHILYSHSSMCYTLFTLKRVLYIRYSHSNMCCTFCSHTQTCVIHSVFTLKHVPHIQTCVIHVVFTATHMLYILYSTRSAQGPQEVQ
jgi:hypothetical protein